jgi:hypothetical protein
MVVWSGSGLMRPTFNNAAGLVTSQAPLPSLAHREILLNRGNRSQSGYNRDGWTYLWLDLVVIDP